MCLSGLTQTGGVLLAEVTENGDEGSDVTSDVGSTGRSLNALTAGDHHDHSTGADQSGDGVSDRILEDALELTHGAFSFQV